jgi:ribonuclease R
MIKPPKPPKAKHPAGLPDDDTLLEVLRTKGELGLSDLARTFGLKGLERKALRLRLKALAEGGKIDKQGRKSFAPLGHLPETGVAEVVERDLDGDLWVQWGKDTSALKQRSGSESNPLTQRSGSASIIPPKARLAPLTKAVTTPPTVGDRLFVRFDKTSDSWVAHLIKILDQNAKKLVGVVRLGKSAPKSGDRFSDKGARQNAEIRMESVDRKNRDSYVLTGTKLETLKDGDVIMAAEVGGSHRYGPKPVKVIEVIGHEDDPKCASMMAIAAHGLNIGFQSSTETEAQEAQLPSLKGRTDLRDLPLITIDPMDARDHDDAVFAQPDDDPANVGGHVVWVAIADVAYYVTSNSSLDRDARSKGNSTYFPDRVEPMLPHSLSSNLCSLREGEDRACMAVRMVFDAAGTKIAHKFVRGLMRSAAKLSYEQAQAAIDGDPDAITGPVVDTILKPLWAAHACLTRGRNRRGPLHITSTERRVQLDEAGKVIAIAPRKALEAHQLIEEMMIQANVSAAETLEKHKTPLIYRVHEPSSLEKINNLADFLATIGLKWNKGEPPKTDRFNRLLDEVKDTEHEEIVNEVVLRTQMQAHYSPENFGHFGLNLDKYAHFTSPIRRYADLIVHRALIRALKLGDDGLSDYEIKTLGDIADHITMCERRSMAAEREAIERYVAAFLEDKVGASFEGRIVGVTRFGLFVKLTDTGADGIVPISSLGDEYFIHDDIQHALIGEKSGKRWRLGSPIEVKLNEAMPLTGGLVFEAISAPSPADPTRPRPRLGARLRATKDRPGPKGGKASYGKNSGAKKKRR